MYTYPWASILALKRIDTLWHIYISDIETYATKEYAKTQVKYSLHNLNRLLVIRIKVILNRVYWTGEELYQDDTFVRRLEINWLVQYQNAEKILKLDSGGHGERSWASKQWIL